MTVITTNYKAQVQARIDAATVATSLKELAAIRAAAKGLSCNEANIDTLITNALNAINGATPLRDLLLAHKASDLPDVGFKNKIQITSSQNWTVPAGVYFLEIWATGGGGAGGGGSGGTNSAYGAQGGQAGGLVSCSLSVTPGQVLQIVVGAKGIGIAGGDGGIGGETTVRSNNLPLLIAAGGGGGSLKTAGQNQKISYPGFSLQQNAFVLIGGAGGGGKTLGSYAGDNGELPSLLSIFNIAGRKAIVGGITAIGGLAGTQVYPGGGGGSSIYGPGGNAGNGSNNSGEFNAGNAAPSTSYGAGGGGSSGKNSGLVAGGDGANGIVEIYY